VSDIEAANALTRIVSLLVGVAWVYTLYRWRGRWTGIWGVLVLVFVAWVGATHPLERLYGMQMPGDRIRNLAWCMTVAAGNSPLATGVVGGISLDPFWASLVAALSFWSPERVLRIYPFLSLVCMMGLAFSLYRHFRRFDELRGVIVAFFAVLIVTAPLDFMSPYRAFFPKMFLLKPNHALGLILIPIILGSIEKTAETNRSLRWLVSGLWLSLLSLVFIVHWVFLCFCLVVYACLKTLLARDDLGRELSKLALIIGTSSLSVAPGVYLLLKHFPAALTLARGTHPEFPMMSQWGEIMPAFTSLLFQVTFDQGVVFYLAVVGGVAWLRQRSRPALLWASVLIGAYVLWLMNYVLYVTARARQADEFYYFVIFAMIVAAGNGVFEIMAFLARWTRRSQQSATALAIALCLPLAQPYWWQPMRMDAYFRLATKPVPEPILNLTKWIREQSDGKAVFLVAGELFQWIPALSGRRTLGAPADVLAALHGLAVSDAPATNVVPDMVDYIVWDLDMMAASETNRFVLEDLPDWKLEYRQGHLGVYGRSPGRD
jgi:hypothetical protein